MTGIRQLDDLVNPVKEQWITEFYGDPHIVLRVMHYAVVYRSTSSRVHVVFNIEFGGLDTLYLVKLCRILNCNLDSVYVSRAFRLNDTINVLKDLEAVSNAVVILVFPYNYLPRDPSKYTEATKITGVISRIALSNQVILFNAVTKHGYYMPEGGSLHHHLVKVIVRLSRREGCIYAQLVKHPAKPSAMRIFSEKALEHPVLVKQRRTILDWLIQVNVKHEIRVGVNSMSSARGASMQPTSLREEG